MKNRQYRFDKHTFLGEPSYNEVKSKMEELESQGWKNLEFQEKGETNCSDPRSDFSWPSQIKGDRPMTDKEVEDSIRKENKELQAEKRRDLSEARKLAKKWKYKVVEA